MAQVFPRASLAKIVGEMPADERTDLYKRLNQAQGDALLPALAQAEREDIRRLSAYEERTAGALMSVVMIGCVIGMSLPFVLNKLGFDPAAASAPLITSVCDASGVLIYLFLASKFLAIG